MTIEVKQMIIKSTVVNDGPVPDNGPLPAFDLDELKEQLLDECREMIAEKMSEVGER